MSHNLAPAMPNLLNVQEYNQQISAALSVMQDSANSTTYNVIKQLFMVSAFLRNGVWHTISKLKINYRAYHRSTIINLLTRWSPHQITSNHISVQFVRNGLIDMTI